VPWHKPGERSKLMELLVRSARGVGK